MSELIADYIDEAMDLMEVRGLTKRRLEDSEGAICMMGGLNIAIYGSARPEHHEKWTDIAPFTAACNAILDAIHATGSRAETVHGWNDYAGRTLQQVLDVGRSAAKQLRMEAQGISHE